MSEAARQQADREELTEEIGDVLASIRKLLAMKQAPVERPAAPVEQPAAEAAGERLVLGSDARVVPLNAEKRAEPILQPVAPAGLPALDPSATVGVIEAVVSLQAAPVQVAVPQPVAAPVTAPQRAPEPLIDLTSEIANDIAEEDGLLADLTAADEIAEISAPATQIREPTPEPAAERVLAQSGHSNQKEDPQMLDQTQAKPAATENFDLFASSPADDAEAALLGNALRDLVREVILEEFQGELGGRISRNLRRAVRQEVASAIAAGLKA